MSMIGYLRETSYAQKKEDLRRYREMRAFVKSLEKEKNESVAKITKRIGALYPDDELAIVGAITACVQSYYIIDDTDFINQGRSNYIPRKRLCEHLDEDKKDAGCRNVNCPFYGDNQRFVDANHAYEIARDKLNVFWKNRFAKHK